MKRATRVIALLLALVMMFSVIPMTAMATGFQKTETWDSTAFTDVKQDDWFYENVKGAYELSLMKGQGEGTFAPLGNITLAETVTVAARIHAIATLGEESFVQGNPWYQVYVDYALEQGILEQELQNYNRKATRLEFAQILSRALPEKDLKAINTVDDGAIPDVADDDAVYLLYRAGVLIGSETDGTFYPDSNIKRSEVAAIVTRMALPELRKEITLTAEKEDKPASSRPSRPDTPVQPTPPEDTEPEEDKVEVSAEVEVEDGAVKDTVSMEMEEVKATVPSGVTVEDGATTLTLTVKPMEETTGNMEVGEKEERTSLDIHMDGVSAENTTPIVVELGPILSKGLNKGNVALYHIENGATNAMTQVDDPADLDAHNEFYYDPITGNVTVAMATFSEIAFVENTVKPWEGNFDYSWYTGAVALADGESTTEYIIANADQLAGLSAIVGGMNGQTKDSFSGKVVKLNADINLGDKETENNPDIIFYPIGYYNSEGTYERTNTAITSGLRNFEGTFDGNGHTVSNFYQNTWEMKGDHNWYTPEEQYYRDGMGLFGKVYGGTVKNLTIRNFSSDGEITTTGCVAAYADGATFENIAIFDCNPRVYNIGNGGIVGCVGWYAKEADLKTTFTNITVDNSNKISALWGSYDVACGGLVGQYYPTSGQSSANYPVNGGIHFENCHVAAQMDVYNDVCGNYMYYAYRYAGMIIGSIRENVTTEDGKIIPDMTGISATGCTVNYGDWNDYYYCEFEKNGHPSYAGPDEYKFSRVPHAELSFTDSNGNGVVDADERASVTGCKHTHTAAEDNKAIYLPFHQLFTGYGWGVNSIGLEKYSGIVTDLGITEGDQEASAEKFETKFVGDFLYRVGNQNDVSVGSLFAAKSATINNSSVYVSIDKIDDDMDVSGTFTANTTDWTKGTIQFSGTGVVKVTIQDYIFCKPTVLYLEVVDAKNATTATNATSNNVVLLNNASGTFSVSNGYSFYGNGFKVTCSGDGSYRSAALSYGFVTVSAGGILDNVQIICDIFPESYMYTSEMKAGSDGRYPYGYSAVVITDNSTISNSYIYGARNNIYVGEGNVTIENTVVECGSLSNIQVKSTEAYTVTLNDVTTIQYQTTSMYDTSKTVLGFGVVVGDNESASNPKIKLEGDLRQYNWVTNADTDVSNTYAKMAITEALEVTNYQHKIDNVTTVNMGIAYLNEKEATITDDRSNKSTIPYKLNKISMSTKTGQVYSISESNITAGSRYNATDDGVIPYTPVMNRVTIPIVTFESKNDAVTFASNYNSNEGRRLNELAVDLDNIAGGSYDFKFSDLMVQKYGIDLEFSVKDTDGNEVDENTAITLNQLFTKEYTLIVTDNQVFNADGTKKEAAETHFLPFILRATKTSIEPPKFTNAGTATAIRLVTSKGGDWRPAYTALTGVSVTYWSASESKVKEVDLSTLYSSGTISSNVWTYTCDDYTLTITGGAVHSDGTTITPVVANNTLYFASTNKAFGTGTTSRSIILTYVFTDKNDSTTWNRTETVTYSNLSEYDYNSFKNNGTLTEPSSGGGSCLAEGTLITLADGSKKAVEDLRKGDSVMAFDHITGEIVCNDVIIVVKTGSEFYKNTFVFDDGTELVTINGHGIYDLDLNRYVEIDHENASEFIGHRYVSVDVNGNLATKKLVDVVSEYTSGYKYDIVTDQTLNYVAEDTLSVTHVLVDVINTFEFAEDMTYDRDKMQADIEEYGLYTYDEWQEYCEISVFEQYNIPVMKVGISKGMYTKDYIISLINTYVLDESVQIIDD